MEHKGVVFALVLATGLSACGQSNIVSRSATSVDPLISAGFIAQQQLRDLKLTSYSVTVPADLRVSEANLYYPVADINWRGEPHGNRYQQVGNILRNSLSMVRSDVQGGVPVRADIVVQRFHSLTEKARNRIGGVHSIKFELSLRDPDTDKLLAPPRVIDADLKAYGGAKAVHAEAQGLTQKKRVTYHLANVLRTELQAPGSWQGGVTQLVAGLEEVAE